MKPRKIEATLEDVAAFLKEPTGTPLPLATLPDEMAKTLRCKTKIIHLYSGTARKLVFEHAILPDHLMLVPIMLDLGWVGCDRKNHLTFLFHEPVVFNKTFKLVIKSNREGRELITSTFHKIDAGDIRRYKKRCALVRHEKQ